MSAEVLPAGYRQYLGEQPWPGVAFYETSTFEAGGDRLRLTQAGDLGVVYGVLTGLESVEGRWAAKIQTPNFVTKFIWLDEIEKVEVGE